MNIFVRASTQSNIRGLTFISLAADWRIVVHIFVLLALALQIVSV